MKQRRRLAFSSLSFELFTSKARTLTEICAQSRHGRNSLSNIATDSQYIKSIDHVLVALDSLIPEREREDIPGEVMSGYTACVDVCIYTLT
jgi:hypothetical protein